MKITLVGPGKTGRKWLGDRKALSTLNRGLQSLGVASVHSEDFDDIASADFVFLSNIVGNLTPKYNLLRLLNKPFGLINFHEDYIRYTGPCYGFYGFIHQSLMGRRDFELERLIEVPDLVYYFAPPPRLPAYINREVIRAAHVCVANSESEKRTILRDCPTANAQVVPLTTGFAEANAYEDSDAFLKFSGLDKKGYVLQVGRLEPRKNQLASVLAMRHFDRPLVFISSYVAKPYRKYAETVLQAIVKWRKAPTIIFSEQMEEREEGALSVRRLKKDQLDVPLLISAYQNCALHLHPAFMELPGYTYLEAAKLGAPTVGSSWATVKDYFTDPKTGAYTLDDRIKYVERPYDIFEIETLIKEQMDRDFAPSCHPILHRTLEEMAADFLKIIPK